jgi:hypothetical protein
MCLSRCGCKLAAYGKERAKCRTKTQNPGYEAEEGYIEMPLDYVGQADAYAGGDFEIEMPPDPLNPVAAARVAADAAHDQSATMHNIADDLSLRFNSAGGKGCGRLSVGA